MWNCCINKQGDQILKQCTTSSKKLLFKRKYIKWVLDKPVNYPSNNHENGFLVSFSCNWVIKRAKLKYSHKNLIKNHFLQADQLTQIFESNQIIIEIQFMKTF